MSPLEDKTGKYYPVCTYVAHQGVIKQNQYKRCERRRCEHYKKAYLDGRL